MHGRLWLMVIAVVTYFPIAGSGQTPAAPQGQPPPMKPTPASVVGQVERGCFGCHDNRSTVPKGPDRQALFAMTPEKLYEAITTGPKASHLSGQTEITNDAQKRATAELITGKPYTGAADRSASAMSNRCSAPMKLDMSRPQWNGWSPDATNTRFQPANAARLTAEQVPQLKLKWAFAMPDASSAGHTQPTIIGGAVFTASDNSFMYALDAKSGCVYWSYDAKQLMRGSVIVGPVKDQPGVQYAAYMGDYLGRVHAVNAETGQHLWTVRADDHPGTKMTAAPVIDPSGGRLYVPVASWEEQTGAMPYYECCTFQGSVVALDTKTGKKLWQSYTFHERPQPLNAKTNLGKQLFGPAGGGIWNTPTLDVKRRALYVGTGNCNTTEHFAVDDWETLTGKVCDAIVAFDMDSGKRLWTTQLLAYDRDEGGCGRGPERRINCPGFIQGPGDDANQTMLLNLPNGRRVIIASQESARMTALDPDNKGAKLWVVQAGDTLTAAGVWGGASDGQFFYRGIPFQNNNTGAMVALQPATGERVWYTTLTPEQNCTDVKTPPACGPSNRSASSAVTGAVFTGSRDGVLRGYSTKDGKIIWEFNTNRQFETVNGVPGQGGGIGAGGPSIVDGMLYVGSGYGILGGGYGNVLLAFGID